MNKINYKNYFLNTSGEFKKIGELKSYEVYKGKTSKININLVKNKINNITKKNWNLNFISNKSIYFINNSKTSLIRISQHWSNECFNIRSCWWKILRKEPKKYKWEIGKITFNKMVLINENN